MPNEPIPVHDAAPPHLSPYKDIGFISERIPEQKNIDGLELQSNRQMVLRHMRDQIGSKQVTIGSLEFVPEWIFQEDMQKELETSCKESHELLKQSLIPSDAHIII